MPSPLPPGGLGETADPLEMERVLIGVLAADPIVHHVDVCLQNRTITVRPSVGEIIQQQFSLVDTGLTLGIGLQDGLKI